MDVFYCGSIQSLGAMMLPMALVLPFSPYFGGGFGDDGGERREVLMASTKDPKDFVVIFSVARVFCVSLVGQPSSLHLSGRCMYPCLYLYTLLSY
jgi:hypothetical protein